MLCYEQQAAPAAAETAIFVLDLNGHFAIAAAVRTGAGVGAEPQLLLVNTTDGCSLSSGAPAAAFDLAFPAAAGAVGTFVPATKQDAVAMGVEHFSVKPLDRCPHVAYHDGVSGTRVYALLCCDVLC
jgi:hypothetical protein